MKVIFIGNPGVGKSTLLNGIIGDIIFRSGISYGRGLTQRVQTYTHGRITYGDTPGLDDIKSRKQAAAEISAALKSGEDDYKLVFVVTLEGGRIRPADVTTMKLVLDALPENIDAHHGIIINKLSKKMMRDINSNVQVQNQLLAGLSCGIPTSTQAPLFLYPKLSELEDEDDQMHDILPELTQYIYCMPSIYLKPKRVKDIDTTKFEAFKDLHEKQLKMLRDDNNKLGCELQKMQKRLTWGSVASTIAGVIIALSPIGL